MNGFSAKNIIVLVVDDSPESLGMLNATLNEAGLTVLVALDGHQALSIVEKIQPDVILLDAVMPVLDGFDTCLKLKERLPAIPIIFMTGLNDSKHVIKGFEAGGVDYITKPVVPAEVLARIRVHSHNARMAKSAQAALDYAGQFIFCVSKNGDLEWATPHAQELLCDIGRRSDSTQDIAHTWSQIQTDIALWLNSGDTSAPLSITQFDSPLEATFAGNDSNTHVLIRVNVPKQAGTEDDLREVFNITKRESQVLYWLSFGKTNWEIAQILDMSPRTVNKHLEQIYKKLEVDNRTSAVSMSIRVLEKS
ncbi:response regulator transcription factor [Vibrio diazotrophicus]|uniref:response regulator transcription factor n=1 Tax=Vibrio diazotrophicus TaxID=685 RepID=UPI000C9E9DF9|nr:DNA-binding response regulator [Vibrio diazotrophicus]PNH91250.1 DNA-binding response regulator [Vibrio diazotrophicus]